MLLVSSVTPIGEVDNVKQLAGGLGTRSGMTDDMYADIIKRWDSKIRTATQKYDWSTADPDFDTFRGIVERFAAAEIRWSFDRSDTKAIAMNNAAEADLALMITKSDAAGKPRTPNVAKEFGSWPRNPNALPYTSIRKNRPAGIDNAYQYPWRH